MAKSRIRAGLQEVGPAMAQRWGVLIDAADMVEAVLVDAACADEVEARRAWLRCQGLALCASPAVSAEEVRRKLAASAMMVHYLGDEAKLAALMVELAVRVDLDALGLDLSDLVDASQSH